MRGPKGFDGRLCYGGDYNPEQWPEEVWAEDVELMRRAGVNLVSVGIFAWSRLEPREGEYEFGWLDRVLDRLARGRDRGRARHADRLAAAVVHLRPSGRAAGHPRRGPAGARQPRHLLPERAGLPGGGAADRHRAGRPLRRRTRRWRCGTCTTSTRTSCVCDHAATAFRRWLRQRHGTLDRLNEAWTTSFWGQHYAEWEHILPPRATQYLANPAQLLDFRRFCSDELLALLHRAARPAAAGHPGRAGHDQPGARRLGAGRPVGLGPGGRPGRDRPLSAVGRRARCRGGDRVRRRPGPRLGRRQPVAAHGAGAGRHPQRRADGAQAARSADPAEPVPCGPRLGRVDVLPVAGRPRRGRGVPPGDAAARRPETPARSRRWSSWAPACGRSAATTRRCGPTSRWSGIPSPGGRCRDRDCRRPTSTTGTPCGAVHAGAWRAGLTVDVVAPGAPLDAYRLVLVPALFVTSAATAAALQSFVESGGHAVGDVPVGHRRPRRPGPPGRLPRSPADGARRTGRAASSAATRRTMLR